MLSGSLSISFMEITLSYRYFEKIPDVLCNPEQLFATFGKWNAERRYLSNFVWMGETWTQLALTWLGGIYMPQIMLPKR